MLAITDIERKNGKAIRVGIHGIFDEYTDIENTVYFDRVIRCINCSYYYQGTCNLTNSFVDESDYCSKAEEIS